MSGSSSVLLMEAGIAIALISLAVTLIGGAIAASRYIDSSISKARHEFDARLDKLETAIMKLDADARVEHERIVAQFERTNAINVSLDKSLSSFRADMSAGDRLLSNRIASLQKKIGDMELFMSKELSFKIRRSDRDE